MSSKASPQADSLDLGCAGVKSGVMCLTTFHNDICEGHRYGYGSKSKYQDMDRRFSSLAFFARVPGT